MILMKEKFGLLLILAILFTPSCRQAGQQETRIQAGTETIVEGTLSGGQGMEVLLEEMGSREYIPVDTVRCDEEGVFHINFRQEDMAFYVLRSGGPGYLTLLHVFR